MRDRFDKISSIRITEKDIQRFWEKVDIRGEDECWEWLAGGVNPGKHYGMFWVDGKTIGAHQFSFMIATGIDVMKGTGKVEVNHSCDNRPCVNQKHLFQGNPKINARDRQNKGRGAPQEGENNPLSKLTWNDIRQIRAEYTGRWGQQTELARKYGVGVERICMILKGEAWKEN